MTDKKRKLTVRKWLAALANIKEVLLNGININVSW
jgi:hypothetical protein